MNCSYSENACFPLNAAMVFTIPASGVGELYMRVKHLMRQTTERPSTRYSANDDDKMRLIWWQHMNHFIWIVYRWKAEFLFTQLINRKKHHWCGAKYGWFWIGKIPFICQSLRLISPSASQIYRQRQCEQHFIRTQNPQHCCGLFWVNIANFYSVDAIIGHCFKLILVHCKFTFETITSIFLLKCHIHLACIPVT